ncbi:MAG: hypothetical protein GX359_04150 [Clostridiales bacterium]|nr:hypothetical protein [Clostridiales bacterium]
MNFDKNKSDYSKLDDMNIKSHLNTSLEMSGISVSEDLIQRTLQAIKEQQSTTIEQEQNGENKYVKITSWNRYARGLTGVAAAALILFAGYHIVNSSWLSPTKMHMENSTADMAKEDYAESEIFYAAENTIEDAADNSDDISNRSNGSQEFAMDTIEQELMLEVPPEEATPNDINKEGIFSIAGATADTIINQFQEICTLTVEQTVKITITDEINQTVLTLTEQEDKEAFYSIMEGYQFSSQAISHEDNLYYTIDIEGADDINYIIRIGAAMVVESVDGEVSSISGYRVHNQEELLRELNVLISKY